jgi:hypothetical protein
MGETSTGYNPLGDSFGLTGNQFTTNPGLANASSVRSMSDTLGGMQSVDLTGLKIISLEEKVPENLLKDVYKAFTNSGVLKDEVKDLLETRSFGEVLRSLQVLEDTGFAEKGKVTKLQEALVREGFEGAHSDGGQYSGINRSRSNVVTVFNNEKVKSTAHFEANPEMVNKPKAETVSKLTEKQTDWKTKSYVDRSEFDFSEHDLRTRPPEISNEPLTAVESDAVVEDIKLALEELKEGSEFEALDPETRAIITQMEAKLEDVEVDKKLVKALATCVRA